MTFEGDSAEIRQRFDGDSIKIRSRFDPRIEAETFAKTLRTCGKTAVVTPLVTMPRPDPTRPDLLSTYVFAQILSK